MSIVHPSLGDFDQLLQKQSVVLVDFWATWSSPCLFLEPVIEEIAQKYDGQVAVARVDVDVERDLAEKYQVVSIPTVMIFKDGEVFDKEIGAVTEAAYESLLKKALTEN
ncbi:MAG: thioredoxin [Selenomonadaceae bacterium]|jgi:thioredoxin